MSNNIGKLELSVNQCFKLLDQSFKRTQYFSCIADNLSLSSLPNDWVIKREDGINWGIKEPETEENKQHILDGYKHFIQCYLVRDCIESFALSLDDFFFTLLLAGKKVNPSKPLYDALSDEDKALLKLFEGDGLSSQNGKVQKLKKQFGIELSPEQHTIISSLKDIRNCFAHSNGFVRNTDGKKADKGIRKFHWQTISITAVGAETQKEFQLKIGERYPEAMSIGLQIKEHSKHFKIGEQLSFSPVEAYEIGLSLHQIGAHYTKSIK